MLENYKESNIQMKMKKRNIIVVGCGRWGSLITWYLDKVGHNVSLYGRKTSKNMQRFIKKKEK